MTNTTLSNFPLIITNYSDASFTEVKMHPENTHVFSGTFGGAQTNNIFLHRSHTEIIDIKQEAYVKYINQEAYTLTIEMPLTIPVWKIGNATCHTRVIRNEKFMRIFIPTKHNTDVKNTLEAYDRNNNDTTRNAINTLLCDICDPLFDSSVQLLRQCIERVHYTTWKNIYAAHDKVGEQFASMITQRNNNILVRHPNDSTQHIPIWNDANKILNLYNLEAPMPPDIDRAFYISPILAAEHPLIGEYPLNAINKINSPSDSRHEIIRYARILHEHDIEVSEYYFR